ncbi:hypothetical protein [Bacillus xiapuensis]|uniref:Uncharacterized protein n=1 Tax=Bacillus xiapuensis TaxID=2014075 RepID=A0ABU6N7Q4_9BACI|nr:hypothetical protein [Bacillus xiapuensis]
MGNETIKINSEFNILFSENENSDSADVKFIICDFNPNANNVSLNRDKIDNWLSTLNFKPVVGKIITRFDGKRDFSGHNAKIVEEVDENGNKIKTVEFDTSAFGSFYETSIETIDDVEYIVAKSKVWKRFKEAYSILKKRAESNKGLKTSWEITVSESHQENIDGKDVKVVDDGEFIGHCLLGEFVTPAYKNSGVLEVASTIADDELAIALSQDMLLLSENNLNDTDDINISNEGGNEDMGKEKEKELSALTDNDLYSKVRKAINSVDESNWYYVSMLYPYDYKAVAYTWDRESEEDFVEFTYTVNSDETISVTAQQNVKMTFVAKATINTKVAELETKLSETEKEIAEAGKSITELSKEKEELEVQVSELAKYKEKVEELEAAEKERELSEKREEFKSLALEDNLITSEELESDEQLSTLISELTLDNLEVSQEKLEVIKGKRAIAKYKEAQLSAKQEQEQIEVSEVKEQPKAKSDLNNGESDGVLTSHDVIKLMIKG